MHLLIAALFLMLGWLTAEHFPPWVSWHNEIWVFVGTLVFAIGGLLHLRKLQARYVQLPRAALIVVWLLIVLWIQFLRGDVVYLGSALAITSYLLLCVIALAAGRYAVGSDAQDASASKHNLNVEYLAALVLLGACCSAGIALAQVLEVAGDLHWITPPSYNRRPGGNMAQPNHLATLLLMGLASLLYLYEVGRLRGLSSIAISFFLICGFAVAESRTGLLSFILLFTWWMSRRNVVGFRVPPMAVLSVSAVLLVLFWFWPPLVTFIQAAGLPLEVQGEVNTSQSLRFIVWPQLVDAALQKPWFGWGLGEIAKAHNTVAHAYLVSEPYTYAHNIVLDLAVGIGIPLTILLVAGGGVWLWRRVSSARSLLPWYCLALALPFGVHSLLEFPFTYAYFLVPALFSIGVLEGLHQTPRWLQIQWWVASAAVLIMSAGMVWSSWEYILLEEDFRIARFEGRNIGKTASDYTRPKIYLLTQLDALVNVARLSPAPAMPAAKLELLRQDAMHFPYPAVQNRYALSLALNGNPEEAVRQLTVMRAMHSEKEFATIRENWRELGSSKYPQLHGFPLP